MMMNEGKWNIANLVDELEPVQPIRKWPIVLTSSILTMLALAIAIALLGMRTDLSGGAPSSMFLVRSGLLALLGLVTAGSLLTMASPGVGNQHGSWKIALAAILILPLGGVIAALTGEDMVVRAPVWTGFNCLLFSLAGGFAIAVPMVLALRRGAPTNPQLAGWLTGIAAGGLGAFAYNFHCPFDGLTYIAVWYGGAVAICALLGRMIVPPLIKW